MPRSAPEKAPKGVEGLLPARGSVGGDTAPPEAKEAKLGALGVKVSGSTSKGHHIAMREDALAKIFGTDEPNQVNALLSHCFKVLHGREAGDAEDASDERAFMLSTIKDLAPRDAIERMLAVQMAATHVATIRAGGLLARSSNLPQVQAHATAYNKLTRSFAAQVEALRKHRTGGKQTVVVQHVNVADGGQAIVGHVETGGSTRGVGQR